MQKTQDTYGYLPYEVQKIIACETGIPLEKIYGVATFYSQFNLSPKGRYRISVCLGTACYVKGSGDIYNKLMEKLGIVVIPHPLSLISIFSVSSAVSADTSISM